ncbi:pentatricopeptide repeat-containing protein At3g18020 isoform X1 [Dendrobium catenatum]|uniref:Pentatricopeptide repeat-containing protein n=1 Tax=Dendrobium catenatum TaxID=906689 RepID=A0A2I0VLU4_9ASPA|nr:pentatricopeptide repeat-containing protein At3g18020 isoform X1 [Dendrobium catenatum]XP_028556823.1 pentatricopeptide repeat-containing protein At3g18020 isoform X1 [Dendrobium catenatum]XP_028556824.1 pentatricopeptide repeat-containing protein At3g18020 isoform X1 [Dendrobium catenatum]XP_028556825.1 pentatricopeptide repeat-containing protein At3g18020 isoform X1 [Dendrobium catenatum]PKU64353.1 Pentatricopeptide repeat-containing protein [Dendrobium catenatum]
MRPSPSHTTHDRIIPRLRSLTTAAAASASASLQSLHSSSLFCNSEVKEQQDEDPDTKSQNIANRSYWTRKIHSLSSSPGQIDAALRLIDRLRLRGFRPDSINLSSIIHGLCAAGRSDEAHRRLLFSFTSGIVPDDRTANVLLARLLDASTPRLTLSVLRHLLLAKPAFVPSLTNYNRLIDQCCSLLDPFEAYNLVRDMIVRGRYPNAVTYTALIDGFGRFGLLDDARRMFDEMLQRNIKPNSLTYSVFIRWLMRKKSVQEGKEMMGRLWITMQQEEDRAVNSAAFANLIDSLCVEGFFHEVFRIAEEMPQGKWVCEKFAYGQMVDSLCKAGRHHGASRIIYIMRKRGFIPSLVSYNSIVHGLSKERGCMRAYQLFREGIEFGYSPPEATYKVLVEALCKEKDLYKAKDVTEFMIEIEGVDKIRIYNIFLSALRLTDNPSEQLNMLVLMLQKQCHPDAVTLNTIVHGFCKIGRVNEALKILEDMMEGKFCSPDVVTFTTAIYGLIDVGRFEEALYFMHKVMAEHNCAPNIVTYNAVLRGLFKLGKVDKSMEIFHEMVGKGVHADCVTHTIIIEGLCEAGQFDQAKKFWDEIVWPSNIHDDYVYAAIMRGLCSLGKLDVACDFLYELVDCGVSPGIVNYNILIDSACKQGMKKQAYQIVGEMRKNGLKLDSVSWRILNKLHERESTNLPDASLEVNGTREKVSSMSEGLQIDEKNECIEKNDGELGDQLEGLVDHSFTSKFIQDDEFNEGCSPPVKICRHGSINVIKVIEKRQKEPLSKLARRVFGLL